MKVIHSAVITYFNNQRGFGFLTTTDGLQFFFHVSNFEKTSPPILEGKVEFEIGPAVAVGKKPQAVNVRYLRKDPRQDALDLLAGNPTTEVRS